MAPRNPKFLRSQSFCFQKLKINSFSLLLPEMSILTAAQKHALPKFPNFPKYAYFCCFVLFAVTTSTKFCSLRKQLVIKNCTEKNVVRNGKECRSKKNLRRIREIFINNKNSPCSSVSTKVPQTIAICRSRLITNETLGNAVQCCSGGTGQFGRNTAALISDASTCYNASGLSTLVTGSVA